jgi:hypothetical protein
MRNISSRKLLPPVIELIMLGRCSRFFSPKILLSNPKAFYIFLPLHRQGSRFMFLIYRVARKMKVFGNGETKISANLNETHKHFMEHYKGLCVEQRVLSSVD